jgi:CelD/BcsL family acetyltransferase involved in cellulose biosynthesis
VAVAGITQALHAEPLRLVRIDLANPAWPELVARDPHALPFHHPAWTQMLSECYDFSTLGLALADTEGRLVAGAPVVETQGVLRRPRWISLPFTDLCPPLVSGDSDLQARLEMEIEGARKEAGVTSVELRAAPSSDHALALPAGFVHTLRLDQDPETTFTRLKPNVRNKIRSAQRSGVTVARAENEDDLTRTFYELHTATRRRLGVPVQPRRYFSLLWRRILEPGLGFLLVARANGRPVAAAVFLAWGGTVVYKYGASAADALQLRPNNALLWHAINWASESGYSTFDFGKTELANKGLREFKRAWGTDEASLSYAVLGPTRVSASRAERALRLAGPVIRHAPPFVCRGLGRALYRYAA